VISEERKRRIDATRIKLGQNISFINPERENILIPPAVLEERIVPQETKAEQMETIPEKPKLIVNGKEFSIWK
jgi:hypothetical protein